MDLIITFEIHKYQPGINNWDQQVASDKYALDCL